MVLLFDNLDKKMNLTKERDQSGGDKIGLLIPVGFCYTIYEYWKYIKRVMRNDYFGIIQGNTGIVEDENIQAYEGKNGIATILDVPYSKRKRRNINSDKFVIPTDR